jgi:hypothetical protein
MRFQAQTSEAAAHWVPKIAARFPDRCSARVGSAPSGAANSRTARHVAGLRMAFLRNRLHARIAAAGWLNVSQNDAVALRCRSA